VTQLVGFLPAPTTEVARSSIQYLSDSHKNEINLSRSRGSDTAPTASIDVLITFDAGGVSGHPNHISLFHGAVRSRIVPIQHVHLQA
jgi:hypothetical protein